VGAQGGVRGDDLGRRPAVVLRWPAALLWWLPVVHLWHMLDIIGSGERGEIEERERVVPLRVGQDGHPMRTRVAVRDDSNSPQIFSQNGLHADILSV
jgi:hypothetical protein